MKFFYLIALLFITMISCNNEHEVDSDIYAVKIISQNIANKQPVSGAKYKITDNISKLIVGEYYSQKGFIGIISLPNSEYTIEEITSPNGYFTQKRTKTFEINDSLPKQQIYFNYINEYTREIPTEIDFKFFDSQQFEFLGNYKAVRIGEYYWVNQNFNHDVPSGYNGFENDFPINQNILDKYLDRTRLERRQFQLKNIKDFKTYYGNYYSLPSILYMQQHGKIYNEYNEEIDGWQMPSHQDFRQLFAMCPFNTTADNPHTDLNERDVRFALSPKAGSNPLAFDIYSPKNDEYKTYWFSSTHARNQYNFNLMPGGARLNGDGSWCNGLGPNNGCYDDGKKGDIYHLFYTAYFATKNSDGSIGAAIIHDYLSTYEFQTFHWLNLRWCRRLSDEELGYKLYINANKTDIKKLDLKASTPAGYTELPNGYLRGFYVQYILNKPNTKVTVKDIVEYTRKVDDPYKEL